MPYFHMFIDFFINFPLLGQSYQVMFFGKIMAHVIEYDNVSSMIYKVIVHFGLAIHVHLN